jgi:hypothetical protein
MQTLGTNARRALFLVALCLTYHPIPAPAAEIGFDAGAMLQLVDNDDRNIISVAAPAPGNVGIFAVQSTRAGFQVGSSGQIETSLGFSMLSQEQTSGDRRTLAHLLIGTGYLYHLTAKKNGMMPYLRGGAQWRQLAATNVEALTQFGVGGGIGLTWRSGRVLGTRIQASTTRWFENSDFLGHWDLGLGVGLSAYTN